MLSEAHVLRHTLMASANITAQLTPPEGHVHFVLLEQQPDPFYLEIPLNVITNVCLHPPKYLRYLGWCILGVEGSLQDGRGHQVNPNDKLVDKGVYHYRLPAAQQGCLLYFFVILKLTTPQIPSLTPLTLRSSSCAARYHLKQPEPGRVSVRN
jgi:hypothetical protein